MLQVLQSKVIMLSSENDTKNLEVIHRKVIMLSSEYDIKNQFQEVVHPTAGEKVAPGNLVLLYTYGGFLRRRYTPFPSKVF